ncbi:hypothetical protein AVEN_247292-1 [Araneus ventricosus]|uniref:Uncharacterized protein n=1 Tax=Araneus ventricosus TaxID=182803 RepID=A0A4Y2NRD0_ARAVE|nr:hypothetical protein AVEN_247292-1 [Araneus ventricosus]
MSESEVFHDSATFHLKARSVGLDEKLYLHKIKDCENTMEFPRGKLALANIDLKDAKKEFTESSQVLRDATAEVRTLLEKSKPNFSEMPQAEPIVPVRAPTVSK